MNKQEKALGWIEQTELFERVREDVASSRIPRDLRVQAAQRLRWLALVVTAVLTFNLVLHVLGEGRNQDFHDHLWSMTTVLIIAIVASGLVWFLASLDRIKSRHKLTLALVYEVALAFWFGVIVSSMTPDYRFPEHGISEICLVILGFSIIVPNPPLRTLIVGLVAASMDPLGYWFNLWMGVPVPDTGTVFLAYYWNYVCAGVAVIPAFILMRLAQDVKQARQMGAYRLVEMIGEGGMGEVWRAQHTKLPREAAVKVIQPGNLASSLRESVKAIARFEIEARATAKLRSQHAIQIYDYGTTEGGTFYYVMEFLQGLDLERLVAERGPVSSERVAHILQQSCHALADAHDQGLIHRDVKPGNIFVCRQARETDFVKVLDFGLVRPKHEMELGVLGPALEEEEGDVRLTRQGAVVGTPAYLAPEMWQKDQPMDGRADIYSLGCVGYWLLTGKLVFEATGPREMLNRHADTPAPSPSEFAPGPVDPELERIVLSCLEKRVDQRPPDAWTLHGMLARTGLAARWTERHSDEWWVKWEKENSVA